MLRVWGRRDSSNVQAVMWCIAELGLDVERIDAGHRFGVVDSPAFRAMNPNGTVPVLVDGDAAPLWESGAILRYLAGRYGSAPFWPPDGLARAGVDMWAEWAKANITANFSAPIFWRVVRTAPADRDPVAVAAALRTLDRFLDIAEARLAAHPFLAGADFTLADIAFGHLLFRYHSIPIERRERPALARYYDALAARPAYATHVMVSYAALEVTG